MSEDNNTPDTQDAPETPETPDTDAPETPDEPEVDHAAEHKKWKSLARKHEQKAKANADAAKRLKELEDADKTEAQKAADRAAEAEDRAKKAEAKAVRLEVAAEKGVPATLLAGSTQEEMEASADALLEFRGEADKAKPNPSRPKEALKSGAAPDAEAEASTADVLKDVPRIL